MKKILLVLLIASKSLFASIEEEIFIQKIKEQEIVLKFSKIASSRAGSPIVTSEKLDCKNIEQELYVNEEQKKILSKIKPSRFEELKHRYIKTRCDIYAITNNLESFEHIENNLNDKEKSNAYKEIMINFGKTNRLLMEYFAKENSFIVAY
jgi:sorbitol-specific phosphotransferase system component IIBC